MKMVFGLLLVAMTVVANTASAEEVVSQLSCQDFLPTEEALERFPNLIGACESVVERDGELFGLFRAIVRSPGNRKLILYIPATDKTVSINPEPNSHVIINGRKTRPRELTRGQEIRIYLPALEFAKPNITEVVLVTESDLLIEHETTMVTSLPTTASLLPALGLGSVALLGTGWFVRRRRISRTVSTQAEGVK